jgi:hypothetical protein
MSISFNVASINLPVLETARVARQQQQWPGPELVMELSPE